MSAEQRHDPSETTFTPVELNRPESSERPLEQLHETNEYQHPYGYFDAQVKFARKWADITGDDFSDVLLQKNGPIQAVVRT